MEPMNFASKWVLVTGASSGLGAEMARQLASDHRANLILVARRADRLEALSAELKSAHGVEVRTIVADLGELEEAERAFREATKATDVYAAVLNAGITHFGHHDELSWESFQKMVALNVVSTARLTTLFCDYLEKKAQRGGILLIASLAGLTPVAYQSAYSGTKAFLVNFGCSLHHEMKNRGVSVTVFAPGGIRTEMTEGERFNDLRAWLVPVGPCANSAIQGLRRRKYRVIPGFIYRVGSWLTGLLPENFLVGQVAAQYRNSLQKNS